MNIHNRITKLEKKSQPAPFDRKILLARLAAWQPRPNDPASARILELLAIAKARKNEQTTQPINPA